MIPTGCSFSILLVSALGFQRDRSHVPIEAVKLFRREIFILKSGKGCPIDGVLNRVVIVRRCDRDKSWREQSLRQQNPHTEVILQRQPNRFSRLVGRNVSAQADILRRLSLSEKLKMDVGHPRLNKFFRQCGDLTFIMARQYNFNTADRGCRYTFGNDRVSTHHTGTHSHHCRKKVSRIRHGYFASKLNFNDAMLFAATVTLCSFSPKVGCQALIRYVPDGRSLIEKIPSRPVIA